MSYGLYIVSFVESQILRSGSRDPRKIFNTCFAISALELKWALSKLFIYAAHMHWRGRENCLWKQKQSDNGKHHQNRCHAWMQGCHDKVQFEHKRYAQTNVHPSPLHKYPLWNCPCPTLARHLVSAMASRDYPPMSISAITTATVFPPSPPVSNYKTFDRHPGSSPPLSPRDHSPPSSPHSVASFTTTASSKQHQHISHQQQEQHTPLSLQERRLRNKAASAKYRQKKNQLQNEMREMISQLSERNAVLERQVEELRAENDKLRQTADRLRGKIFARKLLRQWIGRHKQSSASSPSSPSSPSWPSAFRPCIQNQDDLDLDIDLDDVDEDEVDELINWVYPFLLSAYPFPLCISFYFCFASLLKLCHSIFIYFATILL